MDEYIGMQAMGAIDRGYANKASASTLLGATREPRLTALINRLTMLNERAYEASKRLTANLDRVAGSQPEACVDGASAPRGADAVSTIEGNVDALDSTVSRLIDQINRLEAL